MHDQLPIAEAINSLGQLAQLFRPLNRAEEPCNTLRAAEGRVNELARAVAEGEDALAAISSRVSEWEARARAAEAQAGADMLRLDSQIADRRAELAELDRRIETANVTLASLWARLG